MGIVNIVVVDGCSLWCLFYSQIEVNYFHRILGVPTLRYRDIREHSLEHCQFPHLVGCG